MRRFSRFFAGTSGSTLLFGANSQNSLKCASSSSSNSTTDPKYVLSASGDGVRTHKTKKENILAASSGILKRRSNSLTSVNVSKKKTKRKIDTKMEVSSPVDVKTLSNFDLLARIQRTFNTERIVNLVSSITASARLPSDKTVHALEEKLNLAIEQGSFESYAAIYADFSERYEGSKYKGSSSSFFLLNYVKMLVNYSCYCLINFESKKAIKLFEECLRMVGKLNDSMLADISKNSLGECEKYRSKFSFSTPSKKRELLPMKETSTLYIRLLLATAYMCEERHFEAARELIDIVAIMKKYGDLPLTQFRPGHEPVTTLSGLVLKEEFDQFFNSEALVERTFAETRAENLRVRSKSKNEKELLRFLLFDARLHRATKRYAEAKVCYETYLEQLVECDEEDSMQVMLEFGRMLVFEMKEVEAGLVYLESSCESLSGVLECLVDEEKQDSFEYLLTSLQTAGALIDCAHALEVSLEANKALGVLQEAIAVLERADLKEFSGWAMRKYADLLATVSLTDQAVEAYYEALACMSNSDFKQLGTEGNFVNLSESEVEAHLGYCLQMHVGDIKGAYKHYKNALDLGVAVPGQKVYKIPPEVLHWVHSNLVLCCERLGRLEEANTYDFDMLEMEEALGVQRPESFLRTHDRLCQLGQYERAVASCVYVLNQSTDIMLPETRLVVAECLANAICKLGYLKVGTLLMNAVQRVCEKSPKMGMFFADIDPFQLGNDLQVKSQAIKDIFIHVAKIFTAQRVILENENKERIAKGLEALPIDFSYEEKCIMTLNRIGLFFQYNKFMPEAQEIYDLAFKNDQILTEKGMMSTRYLTELGVLCANYGSMIRDSNPAEAEKYYDKAVSLCPDNVEVQDVAAGFYAEHCPPEKAVPFAEQVASRFSDRASALYTNLANMGVGRLWDKGTPAEKMNILRYALLSSNIAPSRIPSSEGVNQENFLECVSALDTLFLDAVASCETYTSACLVTFLFQCKFERPKLLNKMYTLAIKRFPSSHILLTNYAKFCAEKGYHDLSRMYYAKSYGLENGDEKNSDCYGYYLLQVFSDQQVAPSESILASCLKRFPTADRYMSYANFMACYMATPFKVDQYFKRAIELNPNLPSVYQLYAHFVWASVNNEIVEQDTYLKERLIAKIETLLRKAVELASNDPVLLESLGTFYVQRKNNFEEAVNLLSQAHKLNPRNITVLRQMAQVLVEECHRVFNEESQKHSAAAKGLSSFTSSKLDSLSRTTQQVFESALQLEPKDVEMIEQYAKFSVSILKDTNLAASLWKRASQARRD